LGLWKPTPLLGYTLNHSKDCQTRGGTVKEVVWKRCPQGLVQWMKDWKNKETITPTRK